MEITTEFVTQRILGTDDLSIAQGLAHFALTILTAPTSEISETLFEANTSAKKLLKLLEQNTDCALHNLKVLKEQIQNFDSLCAEIRKPEEQAHRR